MLKGTRIIEIEGIGPGPFAGMMLADLGAEVIVVHREEVPVAGMSDRSLLDRGKRSIVLDLKRPADVAVLMKLVSGADGLIEGFRPGVMERLGLGPEPLLNENPKLVYGRVTGWGQSGPKAKQAGHDLNYIAQSGALWYASLPGQAPFTPPTMLGDVAGGSLYLVAGMLAGMINAIKTGQGTVVDAAIVDGSAHMMNLLMTLRSMGALSENRGQSLLDGPHWSRCYQCADGKWLSVQCMEPQFYQQFLDVLGLQHDEAFLQQHNPASWSNLSDRLTRLFSAHPLSHWLALFEQTDACVAPVHSPSQALHDAHLASRGTWSEPGGVLQAAPAPRFSSYQHSPGAPPRRGQHTEEILAMLNRTD
ncbi:CaiB/BaiF CoA transferase family protein [Aestuariibacter salexigens]|uniref:CaiB/BaiF CoA transferase family protein n=1 Tax=Aestuariibacter salexigens TaxID=226010 RepID=UPI00040AD156|nr:CaiB/BaiF CoA-transferase family protein [Aestuariibacter salexigens]